LKREGVKKLGIFPLTLPSPARGEGEHNESKEEIPSPLRGEGQGGGDKGIFSQLQGVGGDFYGAAHNKSPYFPLFQRGI
jgi:hypothetical protein